jgi:Flp pilus assembly protein TadG
VIRRLLTRARQVNARRFVAGRCNRSGSISVEAAILLPVFLTLTSAAMTYGQSSVDQPAVDLAAANAARTASIMRTWATAQPAAEAAAEKTLTAAGINCTNAKPWAAPADTVQVPPPPPPPGAPPPPPPGPPDTGFTTPEGAPATITFKVTCVVQMVGGVVPVTLWSKFTSPLDTYRARQ